MDRLTRERRSWNMSRISGKNTAPELAIRSFLHRRGLRFRLHRKDLPGRPDIVLSRSQTAIFVHGCFWHRHGGCRLAYTPKSNVGFWLRKFSDNQLRDRAALAALRAIGWHPIVVWECQAQDHELLERRIIGPHRHRSKPLATSTS